MLPVHWAVYLSISALVNTVFLFIWHKFVIKRQNLDMKVIALFFITSFMNSWGIDVIQKVNDITTLMHVMQVSLGCWLLFAAATSIRQFHFQGWSKKKFWIDYGGDFIGYILMGLVVFALT